MLINDDAHYCVSWLHTSKAYHVTGNSTALNLKLFTFVITNSTFLTIFNREQG